MSAYGIVVIYLLHIAHSTCLIGSTFPSSDDETLWEGHASMIGEISSDLKGIKPDAIFCSVGGGGLLAGIIVGCKRIGWDDGTNIFSLSFLAFNPWSYNTQSK